MKNHEFISQYLESKKHTFITDSFGYSSYTLPNTMFNVSNSLPELLLELNTSSMKVFLRTLMLLKRNPNPILACSVLMEYDSYKDLVSKRTYVTTRKDLFKRGLLVATPNKSLVIINVDIANKLYKPKLDI